MRYLRSKEAERLLLIQNDDSPNIEGLTQTNGFGISR